MNNTQLNIVDFDIVSIYGIDCGHILLSEVSQLNAHRGAESFLQDIKLKFKNTDAFEFHKPVYDESEYAKTDRVGRDTFSSFFSYNLMPLSFKAINPKKYYEKEFSFSFHSVKFSPKCALTIRISIHLNDDCRHLNVENLLSSYYALKSSIKNRLLTFFNSFIDCWNYNVDTIIFNHVTLDQLNLFTHSYELIDFDYTVLSSGERIKFKEICDSKNHALIRQFVAISRMSFHYKSYDSDKLEKFICANFGNRDDELWIINEERFIRHHPDSKRNVYNSSFYSDVILGFEILLQQEICLEYLNIWISQKRSFFRNKLVDFLNDTDKKIEEEIKKILVDIANFSNIFSDNFLLYRNVKHSFYNEIFKRAITALSIEKLTDSTKEAFTDFFSLYSLYTSQKTTDVSLKLEKTNYNINKSMKTLNIWIIILTVITIFISLFQILPIVKKVPSSLIKVDNTKTGSHPIQPTNKKTK